MHKNWTGKHYVNGKWLDLPGDFSNENPSTRESLGAFPKGEHDTVAAAYNSARGALVDWKNKSRLARAEFFYKISKIIEKRRDEIAEVISLETGKIYNESIAEVNEALHMAQFTFGSGRVPIGEVVASEISDKDSYMIRKPKGVIAIISPFNFPMAIGAFWCAAPALLEGNTVILKPSEDAPMTSQLCAEIYEEAGVPAGVFNLVHGDGETGDLLIHEDVDHICFTGSAAVGQHIRMVCAQSWNKTCSCEMGSKSACIVFDDAEMDLAIEATIASAFKLSGQRCVSSSRMIVQRTVYDRFATMFAEKAAELKTGDPFRVVAGSTGTPDAICWTDRTPDGQIYYGPLINSSGLEKVIYYNNMVLSDPKAEILLEGKVLDESKLFVSPMVYGTEWRELGAPYLREEVFGPHVAIIPFDTIEDAIHIYNDTDYGLAVGVLTNDFRKARVMRDRCDAGMIYWNGGSIAAESHLSFGGVKKSGNGFPSAARTFRAVTHEVSWTINHAETLAFPQGMR